MSKIITIDKLKTALQSVADLLNSHSDHISSLSEQVDNKVTKIAGMGLSEANYTMDDMQKMVYTNIAYGTCSDTAGTAAKRITIKDNSKWILRTGSIITVMFSYTNTASNPTFNVNNTGAKNVYYQSSRITTTNLSYAGYASRPMTFMYDGTQYRFIGWGYDNNSDTKVTQTVTTTNAEYPLLLAPKDQTTTTTTTSYFNSGVTLNPSTNTISANISGSANKLTTARTIALSDGATGTATSFDGSGDITIPVTAISPNKISEGYTGSRWYLNMSPENNGVIMPYLFNDFAHFTKRGGTVVVKYDGVEATPTDINKVFNGSMDYFNKALNGIQTITIELTLPTALTYTQVLYVDCFSATYRAKDITIEVRNSNYADDPWTVKSTKTDNAYAQHYAYFSHAPVGGATSDGFNQVRYTFSNFAGSTFRLSCLGTSSRAKGIEALCLSCAGGDMYGNITPYETEKLSVGSSDKKFNLMYANYFNGQLNGGLRTIPDEDASKYTQNLIYHRAPTKQGTSADRSFNSPFGHYTADDGSKLDYGSILRLSYETKYYTDIWADANLTRGLVYRQVVDGTSQSWKTLLDSSNYSTHLNPVYLRVDITDAEQGTANLINADSLGGILANQYALKSDLNNIDITVDSTLSIAGQAADAAAVGSHINNKDNPHNVTIEQIGAAPAGYGLGTKEARIVVDANTAITNGFYAMSGDSAVNTPANNMYFKYGTLLVEVRYTNTIHQTIRYGNYCAVRQSLDGGTTWGEWEYENPYFENAIEYRTTERINGKAVYKKYVDGVINYRLDGETAWKPYATALGATAAWVQSCLSNANGVSF